MVDLPGHTAQTNVHVFAHRKIPCDGRLTSWAYYAYATGAFYADVWRWDAERGAYKLVGKNRIDVSSQGVWVSYVLTVLCWNQFFS